MKLISRKQGKIYGKLKQSISRKKNLIKSNQFHEKQRYWFHEEINDDLHTFFILNSSSSQTDLSSSGFMTTRRIFQILKFYLKAKLLQLIFEKKQVWIPWFSFVYVFLFLLSWTLGGFFLGFKNGTGRCRNFFFPQFYLL